MKKGGIGGGNTKTGLNFEKTTDLIVVFSTIPGYSVKDEKVGKGIYYKGVLVANCYRKHDLYRYLESRSVDWTKILSRRLLPDDALYVIANNTLFIIEIKFQQVEGSVDEKLQTCDFKKKQYQKLMAVLNVDVNYIYILDNWFRNEKYKDVLDYIVSVGCQYYFQYLPLQQIGLPVPSEKRIRLVEKSVNKKYLQRL